MKGSERNFPSFTRVTYIYNHYTLILFFLLRPNYLPFSLFFSLFLGHCHFIPTQVMMTTGRTDRLVDFKYFKQKQTYDKRPPYQNLTAHLNISIFRWYVIVLLLECFFRFFISSISFIADMNSICMKFSSKSM